MVESNNAALAVIVSTDLPYSALTAHALADDGVPLVLASDLSIHGHALKTDGRLSLLFTGNNDPARPLTTPRLTLLGRAIVAEPEDREPYLARQPGAKLYFDFGDMRLYRVEISSTHLVVGFGRAVSVSPAMLKIKYATIP